MYYVFWCHRFGDVSLYVCPYYFSSVLVAEWQSFGKELLTRLTMCSLCNLTICNFSYFPLLDFGSDCFSSWSLHTFHFFGIEILLFELY